MLSTNHKFIVYLTTLFSIMLFNGLVGAYSITKPSLNLQAHFTSSFLGFVDLLSFVGRFIGSAYLVLIPFQRPKRMYLVYSIIQTLAFIIIITLQLHHVTVSLCLFVIGLSRSSIMVPYLLLTQYYDSLVHAHYLNIWVSMTGLGNVGSILIVGYLARQVGWRYALLIWVLLFMASALLQQVLVRQIQQKKQKQKMGTAQVIKFFRVFLKKNVNKLLVLDFMFMEQLSFKITLWFPFYFAQLNLLNTYGLVVTIMYPLTQTVGSILHQRFITYNIFKVKYITMALVLLNTIVYLIMMIMVIMNINVDSAWEYIVLVGLSGLFMGGPYSRTAGSQATKLVKGNSKHKYLLVNFMKLVREILSALSMLLIGFCMQIKPQYYIYILFGNSFIISVLHMLRRKQEQTMPYQQQEQQTQQHIPTQKQLQM